MVRLGERFVRQGEFVAVVGARVVRDEPEHRPGGSVDGRFLQAAVAYRDDLGGAQAVRGGHFEIEARTAAARSATAP
ncbi:hypothetical protein [Streptomyces sp. NPDC048428]|uniref:hypothetical protein n=1 Tax=Streptomyces sp. NPDC048428 TaxID=3154503 RepID=UPI0034295801